ncbi:class I SAM-dependent methyltransferase [Nonomuraea jabiensis]|uniref:class I SAM-dependent methyltransferase n=1 Tax=Nonomuraea jabiensis TaxID=882448 RepID=UPI00367FFAA6
MQDQVLGQVARLGQVAHAHLATRFLTDALARGGPLPSGICLELGSGTGQHTPLLADAFDHVIAVDLARQMVRRAPAQLAPRLEAIYPVVGAGTLADIVAEAKANEKVFNQRVRIKLRGSYSRHYRRGLPKLLRALAFRCNNTTFQPVMDALNLLQRYDGSDAVFYDRAKTVPIEHVVPEDWQEAVVDERGRVERIPYELCVLVALRKAIRRREIWVEGGKPGATRRPTCRPTSTTTGTCTTRR